MISDQYCAGLFDGEGSVSIFLSRGPRDRKGGTTKITLMIANSVREPLDMIAARFGGPVNGWSIRRTMILRPGRDRTEMFQWQIGPTVMRPFLMAIQPHAIIKRDQVALALEFLGFCEWRSQHGIERGFISDPTLTNYSKGRPFQRYREEVILRGLEFRDTMIRLNGGRIFKSRRARRTL